METWWLYSHKKRNPPLSLFPTPHIAAITDSEAQTTDRSHQQPIAIISCTLRALPFGLSDRIS